MENNNGCSKCAGCVGQGRALLGRPLCPRRFLESYSLPRLVKILPQEPANELTDLGAGYLKPLGLLTDPLILVSHYKHGKVEARQSSRSNSMLVIPENFQGWLSIVTERGQIKARNYASIQRLVQCQISVFLTLSEITGYVLSHRISDGSKNHYSKYIVKANSILKLAGVYQDIRNPATQKSKRLSWPLIQKQESQRYAQCIDGHEQVVYVPLNATGQFYSVSRNSGSPISCQMSDDPTSKLYQLPKLLRTFPLPVRVCIMTGAKPQGSLLLESYRQEEVILACSLRHNFRLLEIDVNSKFLILRPSSSSVDEKQLFNSRLIQRALKFTARALTPWSQSLKVIHHVTPLLEPKGVEKSASFRFSTSFDRRTTATSAATTAAVTAEPLYSTVPDDLHTTRILIPPKENSYIKPKFSTKIMITPDIEIPYSVVRDKVEIEHLYDDIDNLRISRGQEA